MKNSKIENQDTFQLQIKKFKTLLTGSKMNKVSCVILICISFLLMFNSEKDVLVIASLLLGISVIAVYIFKFLSLKTIEQESYTKTSLKSSVLKFKTYLKAREKYEIYFISIWVLSLIPFKYSYSESVMYVMLELVILLSLIGVFGKLAFKKTEKNLKVLYNGIQMEPGVINNM